MSSPSPAVQATLNAFDALRVEVLSPTDASVRLRIGFEPFREALPEVADREILFELEDGELRVRRPEGAVGLPRGRYYLSGPSSWNAWEYGVPAPPRHAPPPAPTSGRGARKDLFQTRPVHAALLRVAKDQKPPAPVLEDAANKAADRLWKEVWVEIGARLQPEATEIAARGNQPWSTYRALVARPDLLRFAQAAPGVVHCLQRLVYKTAGMRPRAYSLRTAIATSLGYSFQKRDPTTGRHFYELLGDDAAFETWARTVPWGPEVVPVARLRGEDEPQRMAEDHETEVIQRIALATREGLVDPNQLRKIDGHTAWLLFHTVVFRRYQGRHKQLIHSVLQNPAAATRALERHFPRQKNEREDVRVAQAVRAVGDWLSAAWSAHYQAKRWTERLGDASVQVENPGDRIQGFARLCREHARHQRMIARANELGRQSEARDENFLLLAPRDAVRKVLRSAEFEWNDAAVSVLLARSELRQDRAVRPLLLEKSRNPKQLLSLLGDGHSWEVKELWMKLASAAPLQALGYIEAQGFDAAVGWTKADLMPLFSRGGEVALRAMPLMARLAEAERARTEQERAFCSVPRDLFGNETSAVQPPPARRAPRR
jgi:hypothetical protein